jgi:GH25 family lysozyme M1 (1,4-beta-N-acetylmuramidase)
MGSIVGPRPIGYGPWAVDLSQHNALQENHWSWLADNDCDLVILRACRGIAPDTQFDFHARAATRHEMRLGAYLFLQPARLAPIRKQVDTFLSIISSRPVDFLAVDIEDQPNNPWKTTDSPVRSLRQALWLISVASDIRPHIYTYPSFWSRWKLGAESTLVHYPLWGAWYPATREERLAASPEKAAEKFGRPLAVWQYGGGPVDGRPSSPKIDKNVVV